MGKFSSPRLPRVLARERLFRLIDDGLQGTAVWIAGCAGAGKTTLVGSYLESRRRPVFWYRVEVSDRDVAGCCRLLRQATAGTSSPAASSIVPLDALAGSDLKAFFRHYFADLYGRLSGPVTLVFDNAQEALSAATFRALLVAAIGEAPGTARLLIASRVRPTADFALLLAHRHLVLLDPEQLPFTEEESLAVQRLARPLAGTLSLHQMTRLHQLSRGWPAGLNLLLQLPQAQTRQLDAGTTGDQAALFAYLAGEIFEQQDAAVQRILLELACLPRMTAGMAVALTASSPPCTAAANRRSTSSIRCCASSCAAAPWRNSPLTSRRVSAAMPRPCSSPPATSMPPPDS